jgi:hypothetical protein
MQRLIFLIISSVLAGAGLSFTAVPAHADLCGASSWVDYDGVQHVAYRNCGSSTIRRKGHIDGFWGLCKSIAPGTGVELKNRTTYSLKPWGVESC